MDENSLKSIPIGPEFLDVRSMISEYSSLQNRVLGSSAEIKQLYDRNASLVNEILQLKSEHELNGKIKVPYIPREMNTAALPRIPKQFEVDENGNKIFIEPSFTVKYGANEEMPFRNPTAFDGFLTMDNSEFAGHAKKILGSQTREDVRQAIDELNAASPGPSLAQIQKLCSGIKGSFGKEARCYLACLCGVKQSVQAMGAVQPDLSNPTSTDAAEYGRPEEVYTLIDSLPSMEERELVRAALCGSTTESVTCIRRALNLLILDNSIQGEIEDIESPDVCDNNDDEGNNIVVGQEGNEEIVESPNTKEQDYVTGGNEMTDDDDEGFELNVEDDGALN